jgi:two-component system cell cycle response regulator DivK
MNSRVKRILLVEDFEDSRSSLARLLQLEGYCVIEAADGAEAIEIATREKPNLILMDLSLPVIDGLNATSTIRRSPGLESTPIIALSGHDENELGVEARMAGITDYATKPVDLDMLIRMIAKYLHD